MSTKEETLNLQLTIKFCSEGLPKKTTYIPFITDIKKIWYKNSVLYHIF